ncbi:hypothetical protein VC83_01301 [Pseudogymnoascus destructans]|uniref:Uncharacterized protein n=2 Tax=Pseudogymnoascus destructans TaxID=655981 RepID=L8FZA2_PSED2|nr:uncharacterized protein VC83_01301 [Pseudogymnoascus destructans]ELR06167.1 hypothetical protein GMDG_07822 [Pseudogymnoascus destructans 20631-21]OAF62309.1 hypothetical protein VC83_01301 [Pseudogymnoascus destructans]
MASVLKRKRGSAQGVETLKRAKATTDVLEDAPTSVISGGGWDAAFAPINELATVNGSGAHDDKVDSSGAEDFEQYAQKEDEYEKKARKASKSKASKLKDSDWKVSAPIGGRMIDVDPLFTEGEKFLIVAHRQSIHVYSTATSLLHRSIDLSVNGSRPANVRIVAYALSETDPSMIWVACSDGAVYHINWVSGSGTDQFWTTSSMGMTHMTASSMTSAGRTRDIVFTTEERRDGGWRVTAHELTPPGSDIPTVARTIYTSTQPIHILKVVKNGSLIVAASERRVLVANLRTTDFDSVDKIRYEFRVFESTDYISSIDVRVTSADKSQKSKSKESKSKAETFGVVDVVVGDVKGSIFVHNDLLRKMIQSQNAVASGKPAVDMLPRKMHWHRKAVQSVKWSLDGNYIISGGSETVMVLWQLDTGKKQFLPHLSAAIHNIVVSPTGSSYAVRLADNSAMILSTAELKPTASISGLQTQVIRDSVSLDARVSRVKDDEREGILVQHAPAVINPLKPSHLLLAVGENQEINPLSKEILSTPYLQTFDVASSHNISRQALSRTNITNINVGPNAHRISEPQVTHMQISHDGLWLATVDEWLPPRRDLEYLGHSTINLADEQRKRREVYLKFWQWSETTETWELVSRIDAPHTMGPENYGAGRIFDLVVDPSSHAFSTIGEDSTVRIWRPKTRTRDGIAVRGKDGEALVSWSCRGQVTLPKPVSEVEVTVPGAPQRPDHGCLAFSEDGSVLAAALTGGHDAVIHLVDPSVGTVKYSRPTSYTGDIVRMAIVSQYLVTVADEVRVYDIVSNELKYGIRLGSRQLALTLEQKAEMIHLSVDRQSKTFAVALPCKGREKEGVHIAGTLAGVYSQIAVFEAVRPAPLMAQSLPYLLTALVPSANSPGYIAIDAAAEIATITPKASQASAVMAQSIADLGLESVVEEPAVGLMQLVEEAEAEEMADVEAIEEDADDDGAPVVSQQQLANIFDIGPSFALPPIEEMFYQVAGLFSTKPIGVQ